ncbi:MAG: hypothetical protein RJA33_3 [Actinomycetota bacterium]
MACSIDHSTLVGVSFCTECGASVTPSKKYCSQGHESPASKKFCETCGESFSAASAPVATGFTPPPPPPVSAPFNTAPIGEAPAYDPFAYVPPKKNNKLIPIIASISAAALLVVGFLVYSVTKVEYTNVPVTMTLWGEECWDIGWGYFDIPGGDVVLSVDGVDTAYASYPSYGSDAGYGCKFETTFYEVPMNGEYYEFSMANGRRGTIDWTNAEMIENEWSIGVSMGF